MLQIFVLSNLQQSLELPTGLLVLLVVIVKTVGVLQRLFLLLRDLLLLLCDLLLLQRRLALAAAQVRAQRRQLVIVPGTFTYNVSIY